MSSNKQSTKQQGSVVKGQWSDRRQYVAMAAILAVFCIVFVAAPAHADAAKDVLNWIVAIFTKILVYICELLAYILLQLLDFLIQIVQFNNFVNAAPVRIGWPLIRDTINMFFIIVVLVSAFATIIGYPKDFHYRQILPKLLIMAVLINFSKTLIGLMIDFSQVLVLTFVNGFKEAAGGNFINALHIREAMSIDTTSGNVIQQDAQGNITIDQSTAAKADTYQIFNMMLAAIFAIWILSLSITLVIIMVVFFLVRVIMLWFLLITSPITFFAWSLPGKLQKAFAAFTDQWWNRLSTALIGGPVMAFFLWLSLAMAQAQGGADSLTGTGDSSLYKGPSTEVKSNIEGLSSAGKLGRIVVTQIGDPQTFSNFIIMVAFMLLGVQVAIQQSNALAPKLGSLAGAIGSTGGFMGIGVAGTVAAGRVLEKGVRGGAAKVGGAINERYGLTNRLAGMVGRSGLPMTYEARRGLMQHAAEPKKRAAKIAEEMKGAVAQEDPLAQEKIFRKWASSGDLARSMGGKLALSSLAGSSLYAKKLQEQEKEGARSDITSSKAYQAKYGNRPLTEADKKEVDAQVDALARQRADKKITSMQDETKGFAEETNNTKLMEEINDTRAKDPSKQKKISDVESTIAKVMSDHNGHTKIKDDAYMDSATFLAAMKSNNWMDKDGNLTVSETDDKYKEFMRGRQGQHAKAHLDYIRNSQEGRDSAKILLDSSKSDADREKARYSLMASKDGKGYSVVNPSGEAKYLNMGGKATTRAEILENVKDYSDAGGHVTPAADLVSAYQTQLANLGNKVVLGDDGQVVENRARKIEDMEMRLNTDHIRGATNALQTITAQGTAMPERRAAIGNAIVQGHLTAKAVLDIDNQGRFTGGRGQQNRGDYTGVLGRSLQQAQAAGTATERSQHIETIAALAETAKETGGEALTAFTETIKNDPTLLKHAYDNASSAQRASISGAMRRQGTEAESAEAKSKSVSSGGQLSGQERSRMSFKGEIAGITPEGTAEQQKQMRTAIEFTQRLMRGSEKS
ncbi:MAG: hypothetical protein ACYC44_03400 [Patescibacteria group bacterium]